MTTRDAIESALVEDPDDLASHAALADLLHDQGDPRGDLIQVQLALEDGTKKPAERNRLRKREKELLTAHQRTWLGPLAPFLLDNEGHTGTTYRFRRGWVEALTIPHLSGELANALVEADLKLLTELHVETSFLDQPLRALRKSKHLGAVRTLKLGKDAEEGSHEMMFPCDGQFRALGLPPLLAKMPHVEELHLWVDGEFDAAGLFAAAMPHLRYLKLYHHSRVHPLELLADNPTLGRLTHLIFQPSRMTVRDDDPASLTRGNPFPAAGIAALGRSPHLKALTHLQVRMSKAGDDGVRALVESGLLGRLEGLDLRFGLVTDAGARLIAEAGPLPRLRRLELSCNRVTDEGMALLAGHPAVVSDGQWGGTAYFEVQFE